MNEASTADLIRLAIAEGLGRATTQQITHPFDIATMIVTSIDQFGFRIVKKSYKERA
jgi:hypothetical protein